MRIISLTSSRWLIYSSISVYRIHPSPLQLPTDPSSHQASTIGHPSQAQAQAGGSNERPMDDLQARREERARAAEARASAFRAQQ